jgi:tetratricopeptide (TPR) repeat protein
MTSAKERLRTKMEQAPSDMDTRLMYATSLFHLGELPEAETLMKQSLESDKLTEEQRTRCKLFLSAVFIKMYAFYERQTGLQTSEEAAQAFLYLQNALEVAPDSQIALTRLVEFARGSKERLEAARDALRKLISQGNASAMAHFALGTVELIAGNDELSLLNMRQGLAIDPKMAVLANNVAAMIAQTKDGDLDSALRLATQAIETSPNIDDYFDTRAGIHAQMNNLADAAIDYQRALELAPDPRPYQLKLAELYDKMGDKELAAQYRESAKVESRPN